jgi:hypothetical protein
MCLSGREKCCARAICSPRWAIGRRVKPHWSSDSAFQRSRENEISFVDATGSRSLDLHWRIGHSYFASPLDGVDIWQALTEVKLGGQRISTLAPEYLFLFLRSHAAKHTFARLGWICDIARFLMVTPNLDWNAIRSVTNRSRTSRQVMLSVRLAVELFGAPTPLRSMTYHLRGAVEMKSTMKVMFVLWFPWPANVFVSV